MTRLSRPESGDKGSIFFTNIKHFSHILAIGEHMVAVTRVRWSVQPMWCEMEYARQRGSPSPPNRSV